MENQSLNQTINTINQNNITLNKFNRIVTFTLKKSIIPNIKTYFGTPSDITKQLQLDFPNLDEIISIKKISPSHDIPPSPKPQ